MEDKIEDLRLQAKGAAWIDERDPITLDIVFLGDDSVPLTKRREYRIKQIAKEMMDDQEEYKILEGVYLRSTGSYIAITDTEEKELMVISNEFEPRGVGFPEATPWRRLLVGLGQALSEGKLGNNPMSV